MSRIRSTHRLLPSLIDRLIELREDERSSNWSAEGQSLSELQESIRRDLQSLLNTRQAAAESIAEPMEVARSVLTYGLPDLTALNPSVPDQRKLLQEAVEAAIRRFEPRLFDVRVKSVTINDVSGRGLRMSVEAMLRVDPTPVPMAFDTVIEPGNGQWRVRESKES